MSKENFLKRARRLANIEDLVHAVQVVYDRYWNEGRKPGAEKWTEDSRRFRPQMIADVISEWSLIVEDDDALFPWNDDAVCKHWLAFRKSTDEQKSILRFSFTAGRNWARGMRRSGVATQ